MRATAAAFSTVIRGQPAGCERCSAVSGLVTENFLNFTSEIATASLPVKGSTAGVHAYTSSRIRELSYPNSSVRRDRERERERERERDEQGMMASGERTKVGGNERVRQPGLDSG